MRILLFHVWLQRSHTWNSKHQVQPVQPVPIPFCSDRVGSPKIGALRPCVMAYGVRDPFLEGPGLGQCGPNPPPVMEPCLRAIIYSVQHHLCSQSVFFADRMLNAASLDAFGTNSPAAVALELWADALLRAGEYEQVRWQLRGKNLSPRLQYLLAVACIKLEQFQEAQVALLGGDLDLVELWSSHGHLSSLEHVVEGAAGLYQLGQVAEGLRKREQAYECYARCLKLCPFMWCAFERLSWLSLCLRNQTPSQNPREFAAGVFEHDKLMKNDILFPQSEICKTVTPSEKCGFRTPRKRRRSGSLHSMPSAKSLSPFGPRFSPRLPLLDRNPVTPVRTWSPSKVRGVFSPQSLASPKSPKKCHRYTPGLPGAVPTEEEPNQTHIVHPIVDSIDSMHRLRNTVCNVCNTVRSVRSDTGCSVCNAGCRRGKGGDENGDSLRSFSTLLQGLGEALHSLHRFRCQEAIDAVKTLHLNEQRSAFCEDLVARCHFEMQNYEETVRSYGRCCVQHRFFRSFGFEYFSTALWQLGDRLELGNLSRQVLEWGRSRPRAWCVLGNCFSLNNEAETWNGRSWRTLSMFDMVALYICLMQRFLIPTYLLRTCPLAHTVPRFDLSSECSHSQPRSSTPEELAWIKVHERLPGIFIQVDMVWHGREI